MLRTHSPAQHAMSAAVFLFFASNLVWPNGYSIGAALALLTGLYVLATRRPQLHAQLRPIAFFSLLMVGAALWAVLFHGDRSRELDLPLRYLALVVLLWAGTESAPKACVWWAAVAVGSISGAAVAFYDIHALGLDRATGFTGGIQFGNTGLLLGIFCAAGLVWAYHRKKTTWRTLSLALLLLGAASGFYTSIASGSRGGWVAVPVVMVLFAVSLTPAKHKGKLLATATVSVLLATAALSSLTSVQSRYHEAASDITAYEQGNRSTSLGLRLSIWQAATNMIAERPLSGWGDHGYHQELENGVNAGRYYPEVLQVANTHNNYLEVWLKYGFAGVTALTGVLVACFMLFSRYLRHPHPAVKAFAISGSSLVSVYGVACFTQVMLGRNNTLLFFLLGVATLANLMYRQLLSPKETP